MLPPSKIIPFNYVGIVLSLFVDVTMFGHETNAVQVVGILLTSVGLLSNLLLDLSDKKEIKQESVHEEIELVDIQTKSHQTNNSDNPEEEFSNVKVKG